MTIEVFISATDPTTGTRHVQQAYVFPFPDHPPVKRKRLKRLAAAVTTWAVAFASADDPLDMVAPDSALWDAFKAFQEQSPTPRDASDRDLAHASADPDRRAEEIEAAYRRRDENLFGDSPALAAGPQHLRPWHSGSDVGALARSLGEVMLRRNGTAVDIWLRVNGSAEWFALSQRELLGFLAGSSREAVFRVESSMPVEVEG